MALNPKDERYYRLFQKLALSWPDREERFSGNVSVRKSAGVWRNEAIRFGRKRNESCFFGGHKFVSVLSVKADDKLAGEEPR
jgi:hypothetical protein